MAEVERIKSPFCRLNGGLLRCSKAVNTVGRKFTKSSCVLRGYRMIPFHGGNRNL